MFMLQSKTKTTFSAILLDSSKSTKTIAVPNSMFFVSHKLPYNFVHRFSSLTFVWDLWLHWKWVPREGRWGFPASSSLCGKFPEGSLNRMEGNLETNTSNHDPSSRRICKLIWWWTFVYLRMPHSELAQKKTTFTGLKKYFALYLIQK